MFSWKMPVLAGFLLAAAPLQALDLSQMTDAERAAFREEVRAYLMENPQVILDAVQALESRQAQQQAQADIQLVADNLDALVNDGFSWVGGNPEGDITLVEFLDYRCGYCRRAHNEVAELLSRDGNIRWVVKEFPILGEQSLIASRFAVATKQIAGDEAYSLVHDALMTMNSDVTERGLSRLGRTLGLDVAPILDHMNSEDVSAELRATRALAQRLRISGTPTFVVQDELVRGYLPAADMLSIVEDKRG
ncbi:MAG: DsbA family protein [Rhodobacteraceae bacterium]|nr:DsbA family protein [Paracoccaceae bacterium]